MKETKIVFKDWNKGMVRHPIYGKGRFEMVEVFENPGILKVKSRRLRSYTTTGMPVAKAGNYVADGLYGGKVYNGDGTVLRNLGSSITDMILYKDYLLVRNGTRVSFYGPLSTTPQWFDNVITGLSIEFRGQMKVGQDDFLYITNGNFVARASITPQPAGTAPTVSVNLTALDLPNSHNAVCLEELGTKLMIGTSTGRIYGWNRLLGTLGNPGIADEPVILNENTVWAMKQNQNRLWVLAGSEGNVYESNGSSYLYRGTVPHSKESIYGAIEANSNCLAISSNNTLLIGIISITPNSIGGVYEMDLKQSSYPFSIAYKTTGGINTNGGRWGVSFVEVSFYTTTYGFINEQSNLFGVDTADGIPQTPPQENYISFCETELVGVGSAQQLKAFERINISLAEPLTENQKIRVSYRKDIYSDYVLIKEFLGSEWVDKSSLTHKAVISKADYLQLKIEIDNKQPTRNIYIISVELE